MLKAYIKWLDTLSLPIAAVVVGLSCWLLTSFLYGPQVWHAWLGGGTERSRAELYSDLCANPFRTDIEPILRYRIVAPSIAWLLGLQGKWVFLVQFIPIPISMSVIYYALAQRTRRDIATIITACLSLTYTFVWTNTFGGFTDSITHLCVALMLLTTNSGLTILLLILSALNDERTIFALPFLVLWHMPNKSIIQMIQDHWKYLSSMVVGGLLVLLIRHALTVGWIGPGIPHPAVYTQITDAIRDFGLLPFPIFVGNLILGYRFVWLIPLLFLSIPLGAHSRTIKTLYVLSFLCCAYITLVDADVSRTICFSYPAILVAVSYLYKQDAERIYRLSMLCLTSCILTPQFYLIAPDRIHLFRPLLIGLLQRYCLIDPLSPAIRSMYPILDHIEPH